MTKKEFNFDFESKSNELMNNVYKNILELENKKEINLNEIIIKYVEEVQNVNVKILKEYHKELMLYLDQLHDVSTD